MKNTTIVLAIVSLGLGAGLLSQHQQATQAVKTAEESRTTYSNSWEQAKGKLEKLDEVEKVAAALETKLNARTEALTSTSNELVKASTDLAQANTALAQSQAAFTTAQAEMKKQQAQIAELEAKRDDLARKMDELTASIGSLETKIADTKKKLASSEGDRTFLLKELERLQNEKSALVAQFNNLAAM